MRLSSSALAAASALCAAIGVFWLSLSFFQSEEEAKARGRLSLYRSTVLAELERFSHLTYVLARDTYVIETGLGAPTSVLDKRLAAFAVQSGLDAIYLMQADGTTISASNADEPETFVGQDYSFRPYYQAAITGVQGRFYGIGATTGLPGYFIADAVRTPDGDLSGVIAIKLDLTDLEEAWRAAGEQVFLANSDGVVLLSSNPDWRYRTLGDLSEAQRSRIAANRQFPGQPLDPLNWQPRGDARALIDGAKRIHLAASVPQHDWKLHYFADDSAAVTRSWLVTGMVMILAGAGFMVSQVRRTQRIGAALRRSEAEEAQLRLANDRLAVEIEDRRTAERRLKRTQDELERASRLAALGQLAASVTHELGQPIAAMRNHLAAAEIGGKPAQKVIPQIAGIVDRMEGITRQLKFFARSDHEVFREVDLRDVVNAALSLLTPNIEATEVTLDLRQPPGPIMVRGHQLRLEQVMTNVLRNAVDALEECDERVLHVRMGTTENAGWVEVRDTGHGLGAASLSDLQEPFVTTRESGRGMGLGLAISANIVKEHHGRFSARNAEGRGAVFRVEIPMADGEEDKDQT